jgi:hypothetical protein
MTKNFALLSYADALSIALKIAMQRTYLFRAQIMAFVHPGFKTAD